MINLNQQPAEVFNLKNRDVVLINGVECVMRTHDLSGPDAIYFTTVDSRMTAYQAMWAAGQGHEAKYKNYVRHARIGHPAVNTRAEFQQALLNDQVLVDPPFFGV